MLKKYRFQLIISSLLTLLPILFGVIFWDKLPEMMPVHWDFNNNPDRYASREFAVFVLPLIVLVLHWLCFFGSQLDKRNKNQNPKIMGLMLWICPIVSLFGGSITYLTVFGKEFNAKLFVFLLLGMTFLVIGNYMPKCRQSRTVGIKIYWTLRDEQNWDATHRFAGKVWVLAGLLFVVLAFVAPDNFTPFGVALMFLAVLAPMIYSYLYSKKNRKED